MKHLLLGLALLSASSANAAAPATTATTAPTAQVTCDVVLNVDDPDPKGLNVRATPSAKTGRVIAVLKPDGDWTEVHVVGQSGDWLQIDHADTIDDNAPDGARDVFKGRGWVHISKLGISELFTGDGTVIRARPSDDGAVVLKVDDYDKQPTQVKVLGCDGKFIHVDADGHSGWTRNFCTNERTTCS